MKCLYQYPQAEFPYAAAGGREPPAEARDEPEFELPDTGFFDGDRYFDVVVEYAKAAPDDILIRITTANRGPEPAPLHLLPTLWLRNSWSWGRAAARGRTSGKVGGNNGLDGLLRSPRQPGRRTLAPFDGAPDLLFTENETNTQLIFGDAEPDTVREGRHSTTMSLQGAPGAVNPARVGHQGGGPLCAPCSSTGAGRRS